MAQPVHIQDNDVHLISRDLASFIKKTPRTTLSTSPDMQTFAAAQEINNLLEKLYVISAKELTIPSNRMFEIDFDGV